jgi:hypothetical protein
MLPFKHTVRATDSTINRLIAAANHFGIEEVDWTYEWSDGGRAVFSFDSEEKRNAFKFLVWGHQISN